MSNNKEVTMKSDDMARSWVAQMASQTMGIILQTRQELNEKDSEYQDDLDWHRMRVEDLEEEKFALNAELENEKDEKADLKSRLNMVERERDQFKECWLQSKKKIIDLEVELNSIKKSDAATPDQKEKAV
jgi:chromosome segregation ATPase